MPRIIYTRHALADLTSLRVILRQINPEAAQKAIAAIRAAIRQSCIHPERFRPVPDLPGFREIIIGFGHSGYVARFHHAPNGDIIVARIRHQLERA
ncbi:MAG: type II toxin-antitoxin system RelE/ParE family toxin [Zoogloeaceae bacterium]|jgi:plasmid stabilization system protein ParE|nr:type II toxin-antitoxin system RelE/ParE family toxin [Zoogloeaceae bacterium]